MPSREGCRVFLGNLPYSVRERDIERFFERYGRVYNIFIKSGKYGFCEFDDYRDADDAVYKLNGCELNSERITVEHARGGRRAEGRSGGGSGGGGGYRGDRYRGRGGGRGKYGPPTRTNYRVIVENLSTRVSWQDLKDVMRRAGEVTFADAHNDKRNEGVVEFISRRDMERAIDKFDNHELHGRRIRLVRDRSTSRSRSRSGSRSSYSRSRSRSSSRSRSRSYERKRRSRSCDSDEQRSRRRRSSRESNERRRSRSSSADSHKEEYRSSPPRDNGKRSRSPEENGNDDSHTKRHRRSESLDRRDDMSDEGRNSVPPPGEDENPPPPGVGDD